MTSIPVVCRREKGGSQRQEIQEVIHIVFSLAFPNQSPSWLDPLDRLKGKLNAGVYPISFFEP